MSKKKLEYEPITFNSIITFMVDKCDFPANINKSETIKNILDKGFRHPYVCNPDGSLSAARTYIWLDKFDDEFIVETANIFKAKVIYSCTWPKDLIGYNSGELRVLI
jgi:hypothetical protein